MERAPREEAAHLSTRSVCNKGDNGARAHFIKYEFLTFVLSLGPRQGDLDLDGQLGRHLESRPDLVVPANGKKVD